ncbi:MAG: TonB-dependent receptor, partial [Desulfovibrionales bacterium]|nr:TonB-dependent receptor [Desulfovibrionales bacterium]
PTATAYRNEYDINSVLAFDLDSIEISKGYSSPLLQHNNGLAGVINVRTAKPKKELEFAAKYTNFFDRYGDDQGRLFGIKLGTKQDWYYLLAQVMQDEQDFFTLSHSFNSGQWQEGGRRGNSDYNNKRLNVIAGLTPTENIDVMFGVVRQEFEKGQPLDASKDAGIFPPGTSTNNADYIRAWRWPKYETNRYYMNADITCSSDLELSAVAYYDEHIDQSVDYADPDFNNKAGNSRDQKYDQYTAGGHLTLRYDLNEDHKIGVSAGYRALSHKEYRYRTSSNNWTNPLTRSNWGLNEEAQESYYDTGLEYSWNVFDPLTLVFGLGYTRLEPDQHKSYQKGDIVKSSGISSTAENLFNYQLGVFYDLTTAHQLSFTFAHKERVATMRERYMKMTSDPDVLANPGIDPEAVDHFELGYRGIVDNWLKINVATYYSLYDDKITSVTNYNDPRGGGRFGSKFANLDKVDVYGLDVNLEASVNKYVSLGASAGFMGWDVDSDTVKDLPSPKEVASIYAVLTPLDALSIIPEIYMRSKADDGSEKIPGFATVNVKATYDFNENLMLEAGIKNLLDKNYYYSDYYPEPGMSFFTGIKYVF